MKLFVARRPGSQLLYLSASRFVFQGANFDGARHTRGDSFRRAVVQTLDFFAQLLQANRAIAMLAAFLLRRNYDA